MNKTSVHIFVQLLLAALTFSRAGSTCTNFLVSKGASEDGSVMISYSADSHVLYGELYYTPASTHVPGEMLEIYEWDTGKHLGQIPQVARTFSVVGNINEHQVAIGETTYGGRKELRDPGAVMDYGSLMYVALQRSKTAQEAIMVMTELVAEHGYYSSGESFSISDPEEVWIMEMIGKGPEEKGAVWVARKVPDGYISAHANQSRIMQFPLDDSENTLYSEDVITFARKMGYFDGKDEDFSFADAYSPLDFGALRFCEARVWAMYRRAAPSMNFTEEYVTGKGDFPRLPLFIKPDRKLGIRDVIGFMRDHFEGSSLDLSKDIGAGPYSLPYRWRPLVWKSDGLSYFNERSTSTQQTGFSFVTQSRSWLPDPVGGIIWFGVDDTFSTVYVPMYCGIREAPYNYAVGTGDFHHFTWDSAFWVFNFTANYAYSRYSEMIKDIQIVQQELEGGFFSMQTGIDRAAIALYQQSPELARDYLTEYSKKQASRTVERWRSLGEQLLVKYLDGNLKDEHGKVSHPGYPEAWYRRIVEERGNHFRMRRLKNEPLPVNTSIPPGCHVTPGRFETWSGCYPMIP